MIASFPLSFRPAVRILILGLALLVAECEVNAATSKLSKDQALAAAREFILTEEENARAEELSTHQDIALDASTWGRNYFAFRFPDRSNTQYHVRKSNGFVHAVVVLSGGTPGQHVSTQDGRPTPDATIVSLDTCRPTITRRTRQTNIEITLTFPESLATHLGDMDLSCRLWEPGAPPAAYLLQESKKVLHVRHVNTVRILSFTISQADAQHFPTLDIFLHTSAGGVHWPARIEELPSR